MSIQELRRVHRYGAYKFVHVIFRCKKKLQNKNKCILSSQVAVSKFLATDHDEGLYAWLFTGFTLNINKVCM